MDAFAIRGFNPCESLLRHTPEQLRRFIRRMKTLDFNTLIVHYDYGWQRYKDIIIEECRNAGVNIILMTFGPRTFFSYTDWKTDWFAKNEQGESYCKRLECETYPCASNPEALEAYGYGARQWLKSLPPEIKHVHMRAADGNKTCQCPGCRNLPHHDKWQPFVDEFVEAVLDVRSDLKFETDVYIKRFNIPAEHGSFHSMTNIMYDTFFRRPIYPIGDTGFADPVFTAHAATEKNPDAKSPNEYHLNRLKEWSREFPGKVYIHENAMAQAYCSVFQHGTWSYVQDMETFRKLGIQGVCYEAFEPGYCNFEDMFSLLSRVMKGEEVDYQPTELEKIVRGVSDGLGHNGGTDYAYNFSKELIEKYIDDPVQRKHSLLYRDFMLKTDVPSFRAFVTFMLENKEKLDAIYSGSFAGRWGIMFKKFSFCGLSDTASDMVRRGKLWDFMEDVPLDSDPRQICFEAINELLEKAVDRPE